MIDKPSDVKDDDFIEDKPHYGTCKFCGQQVMVHPMMEVDQDELDRMASEACDCVGAREARKGETSYLNAVNYIDELIFLWKKNGIINSENPDDAHMLKTVCLSALRAVCEAVLDSVTLKVDNVTLRITRSADKIKFKTNKNLSENAEF